jgi:integrase
MGAISAYDTAAGRRYRVRYRKPDRSQTDKRGFRTKREAELFLASVQVAMARGEFVDATAARETIGVLGASWLRFQTHLKPSSVRPVEIAWRRYVEPRWRTTPVSAVRYSDVQEWVAEISEGRSATTVLRAHGVLASILDVAARDRRISSNPARGVKMPRKNKKAHTYLTHEQVSTLALECGDKRTFVLVLAYCGLRWGEAVGLRVQDVDLGRRRLNVSVNAVEVADKIEVGTPKTHKRRSVPFPALLGPALVAQCAGRTGEQLVFDADDGGYLRRTRTDEDGRGRTRTDEDGRVEPRLVQPGGPPVGYPADDAARPSAYGREPRDPVRCERARGAADARPRLSGDDAGRLRRPLRRRPRPRREPAQRGTGSYRCGQNVGKRHF